MQHRHLILFAAFAVCTIMPWSTPSTAAPQKGQAATWRPHDMIVSLHHLPQRYSCDDLWYKFRDVLLALGARPDMKILVYQCGASAGALGYSPRVHLQFSTPELLDRDEAKWAQMQATTRSVRLTSGQPPSLRDSDCELMRQIKDGLLPEVTQRIVSFDLACAAPRSSRWPFSVTVQAITPVKTASRVAAEVGASSNRVR